MKNVIYAVVIAVCLLVAVVVFMMTRSGGGAGLDSIDESEQVWVKCRSCGAAYQMGKKQYYEELNEKAKASTTAMMFTPPLTCQKCTKNSVFLGEMCEHCNEVFFPNSVPNDFPDKCPKCKRSKTEESRKARLAEQGRQ
jgi:phage FluMu protein Com